MEMEVNKEVNGAQTVMGDETWKFAIDYIDKKKEASTSEAVSNGIWNEILRRNFPYPKFIIAPEQRQPTGIRPDFTIFFVDETKKEWHPVFTFEGKAAYHERAQYVIDNGVAQAAGYIPSLSWSNHEVATYRRKLTYGMFACGKSFKILRYNVDNPKVEVEMDSSLDKDAKGFDDFCKERANSFY